MKNRIYYLLVVLLICSSLQNTHAQTYSGGTGTLADPFLMTELSDLHYLSLHSGDWNKHFKQMNDIEAAGTVGSNGGYGFSPIGNNVTPFTGTYDGHNYKITGITMYRGAQDYIGMFGYTGSGADLKNIGLEGCVMEGKNYMGCLVGFNLNGNISHSYTMGNITATADQLGGLVGHHENGVINNCFTTTIVHGQNKVGGLVGFNGGTIIHSYSTGQVWGVSSLGGLIGDSLNATVIKCFWNTQTSFRPFSKGGTGKNTLQMQTLTTYTNGGWDFPGDTNGVADIWKMGFGCTSGGYPIFNVAIPLSGSGTIANPYLVTSLSDLRFISNHDCFWNKHFKQTADIDASATSDWNDGLGLRPIGVDLSNPFSGTYDGQGFKIINLVVNRQGGLFGAMSGTSCELKNMAIEGGYVLTGGGLVGANHDGTINNCYATDSILTWGGGLVGMNMGGTIINCHATGMVTGGGGGLVGHNQYGTSWGTIINSYATGPVTATTINSGGGLVGDDLQGRITNCFATGQVSGPYLFIGGLLGTSYGGKFDSCYATGSVNGYSEVGGFIGESKNCKITNCHASGLATGGNMIGGLIGYSFQDTVNWSYANGPVSGSQGSIGGLIGTVTGSMISNSYATGPTSGDTTGNSIGGLVGDHLLGTIQTSFANNQVNGLYGVGGLVGNNNGAINNCYATGSIYGYGLVGGLVGNNNSLTSGGQYCIISKCYSTGTVNGPGTAIQGLVGQDGYAANSNFNCFWDVQTSGQTTSSGGTGKTTVEMKTQNTFTDAGWDFIVETTNGTNDIWKMADCNGYPIFAWQSIVPSIDITTDTNSTTIHAHAVPATYQWVDCDNNNAPLPGETGQSFTATINGNYAVIITQGTCSDTSDCININSINTASIEESKPGIYSIFPNPTTNQTTLVVNDPLIGNSYTLYDNLGKILFTNIITNSQTMIDLTQYSPGIYFIQLSNGLNPIKLVKH